MKKGILLTILLLMCLVAGAQAKSMAVLGDSYSTFEGAIPEGNAIWYFKQNNPNQTDVNSVDQTWWTLLTKRQGWTLLMNNSYSGSTICNTGYNKADYSDRSFTKRMDNLGGNPDVIFIFGATNDSWAHAPIGEFKYENITKDDLWSFRPAMAYMLDHVKKRYPNVKVYFLLNSELRDDINESCLTICNHYAIPCIRLHDIHKINGHPSKEGMKAIARQVLDVIK
jgi:lysophospholipase L1-like esterase